MIAKNKKTLLMTGLAVAMMTVVTMNPELVYAAGGAADVTAKFNSLKDIVTALVSSIGTIVLLWGFFEWGTSMQSTDGVMQSSAFKRIGGGLIMVLAPQLLSAFV